MQDTINESIQLIWLPYLTIEITPEHWIASFDKSGLLFGRRI